LGDRGLSEEFNIKIDPEGIGFWNVGWFPTARVGKLRRAIVNALINFLFPQNFRNFLRVDVLLDPSKEL
jgi:hypothetical protein